MPNRLFLRCCGQAGLEHIFRIQPPLPFTEQTQWFAFQADQMSGQWLNCSEHNAWCFFHQNSLAALPFAYDFIWKSRTKILWSWILAHSSPAWNPVTRWVLYGRHKWKVDRSWEEDPLVESWSSTELLPLPCWLLPAGWDEKENPFAVPSEWFLCLLYTGEDHIKESRLKGEVCWRLHIDRWACSSSWCTTYGEL